MPEETATRLIADISSERLENGAQALLRKKGTLLHEFFDAYLYTTGDDGIGYYYLVSKRTGRVVYFVRYRLVKANDMRFGRQVLVWRTKDTHGTLSASGLAKKVFNNYLLPRFGRLITDTQQTLNGKAFWEFMINEAFDNGKFVYVLDRRSQPNRLWRSKPETINQDYDTVYGTNSAFEHTHFVISNSAIVEF
jgi:hypothetical protein